jgi:hypothetical protein
MGLVTDDYGFCTVRSKGKPNIVVKMGRFVLSCWNRVDIDIEDLVEYQLDGLHAGFLPGFPKRRLNHGLAIVHMPSQLKPSVKESMMRQ